MGGLLARQGATSARTRTSYANFLCIEDLCDWRLLLNLGTSDESLCVLLYNMYPFAVLALFDMLIVTT